MIRRRLCLRWREKACCQNRDSCIFQTINGARSVAAWSLFLGRERNGGFPEARTGQQTGICGFCSRLLQNVAVTPFFGSVQIRDAEFYAACRSRNRCVYRLLLTARKNVSALSKWRRAPRQCCRGGSIASATRHRDQDMHSMLMLHEDRARVSRHDRRHLAGSCPV